MNEVGNSEMLYHYTSFFALEKILRNKTLRLGDLQSMNDCKETVYFMDMLESEIINQLAEHSLKRRAKELMKKARGQVLTDKAYAFCLSEIRDDVAQWDRYAHKGQGISIGFSRRRLEHFLKNNYGYCYLQSVFYNKDIQKHEHLRILQEYLTSGHLEGFSDIDGWINNLHATASAFKHPSFASEKEVRILSVPGPEKIACCSGRVMYEAKGDRIKGYFEMDIPSDILEQIIAEIIIGPCSSQTEVELSDILTWWGYSSIAGLDRIRRSECPLRLS